jgi:hypothetical protein
LRLRLTTGLPFSQRTQMRVHAHIITNGDESAMNFEGVDVFFFGISIVFRTLSAYWQRTSRRTWLLRQSGSKKPHRAGPMGLAYAET